MKAYLPTLYQKKQLGQNKIYFNLDTVNREISTVLPGHGCQRQRRKERKSREEIDRRRRGGKKFRIPPNIL